MKKEKDNTAKLGSILKNNKEHITELSQDEFIKNLEFIINKDKDKMIEASKSGATSYLIKDKALGVSFNNLGLFKQEKIKEYIKSTYDMDIDLYLKAKLFDELGKIAGIEIKW